MFTITHKNFGLMLVANVIDKSVQDNSAATTACRQKRADKIAPINMRRQMCADKCAQLEKLECHSKVSKTQAM